MSKYLISKGLDPLFALAIGGAAAWSRIRREELLRFALAHPEHPTSPSRSYVRASTPKAVLAGPSAHASASTAGSSESAAAGGAGAPLEPPTAQDTLDMMRRLLRRVPLDPRRWDFEWSDLWKPAKRWGIVEPNQ